MCFAEVGLPRCDEPCGVELGKGAKNVEMERCPGVDVELRLVVIPPALAEVRRFRQLSRRYCAQCMTMRSLNPMPYHSFTTIEAPSALLKVVRVITAVKTTTTSS